MSTTKKMNKEDLLELIDCMSPTDQEIDRMMDADRKAAEYDEYYEPRKATILVPVEVEYHYATDVVYRFTPPSIEDVENAYAKSEETERAELARLIRKYGIPNTERW